MGRVRGVEAIVAALCADFERRQICVRQNSVGTRTGMEYLYLNAQIWEAACEQVGCLLAADYIREIGEQIGYARSSVEGISEGTYKRHKHELVQRIARRLHLMD